MTSLESSPLDGFSPIKSYRLFGVDCLSLENEDGVSVELTEKGVDAVDRSADIGDLIGRMSEFITQHNGYIGTERITKAEPSKVLMFGSNLPTYRGAEHLSSVYHPEAAKNVIVKAYDYERYAAPAQFYWGAWLHDKLEEYEGQLSSPKQIALLRSPDDMHRTAIMEYMRGVSLADLMRALISTQSHTMEEMDTIINDVISRTRRDAKWIAGTPGKSIINDIHTSNVILPEDVMDDPESACEGRIGLIDQPYVNRRMRLYYMMASKLAYRRHRSGILPSSLQLDTETQAI